MYHYNARSPASGAGQVTGQYPKPPAALVTMEAAPISAHALTWNVSGKPPQSRLGP